MHLKQDANAFSDSGNKSRLKEEYWKQCFLDRNVNCLLLSHLRQRKEELNLELHYAMAKITNAGACYLQVT